MYHVGFSTVVAITLALLVLRIYRGDGGCLQPPPLVPSRNSELWERLNREIDSEAFEDFAIESLQKAVQIPCVVLHLCVW